MTLPCGAGHLGKAAKSRGWESPPPVIEDGAASNPLLEAAWQDAVQYACMTRWSSTSAVLHLPASHEQRLNLPETLVGNLSTANGITSRARRGVSVVPGRLDGGVLA